MGSPGDLSEIRGILTVVSFLSIFVLLTSMIPAQFAVPPSTNRAIDVPEEYSSDEVLSVSESTTYETLGPGFEEYFLFGGREFGLHVSTIDGIRIAMRHFWTEYWFLHYVHYMNWYHGAENVSESFGILLSDIDATNATETYTVSCVHVRLHAMFGYNETDYSSVTDAYSHSALGIWLGIDWNETATTFDAWNLVGAILFFQAPDIHPVINALIAIPIWITIAYLIFTLITKLFPFT